MEEKTERRKCFGRARFWELSAIILLDIVRGVGVIQEDSVLCGCLDTMQARLNELADMPDLSGVDDFEMLVGFYPPDE